MSQTAANQSILHQVFKQAGESHQRAVNTTLWFLTGSRPLVQQPADTSNARLAAIESRG